MSSGDAHSWFVVVLMFLQGTVYLADELQENDGVRSWQVSGLFNFTIFFI